MRSALCVQLLLALDSALRNQHSAFEWVNFFMDDNLLRFLKYDIARPDPQP